MEVTLKGPVRYGTSVIVVGAFVHSAILPLASKISNPTGVSSQSDAAGSPRSGLCVFEPHWVIT